MRSDSPPGVRRSAPGSSVTSDSGEYVAPRALTRFQDLQVEQAAANLARFARRIDSDRCGRPALLGVIVGAGYGYVREDGIAVIPIGALGP
jgi:hypothetical protein